MSDFGIDDLRYYQSSPKSKRVLAYLKTMPEGATRREIAAHLGYPSCGRPKLQVGDQLEALLAMGLIDDEEKPYRGKRKSHTGAR